MTAAIIMARTLTLQVSVYPIRTTILQSLEKSERDSRSHDN